MKSLPLLEGGFWGVGKKRRLATMGGRIKKIKRKRVEMPVSLLSPEPTIEFHPDHIFCSFHLLFTPGYPTRFTITG